jgi:small subunit ribosomal protein S2
MKEYIFGERNGIYIIDLQKTLRLFKDAVDFVSRVAAQGKPVLFVGTKRQAQEAVEEEALRCGMYYVNNRWLGGLLTNFSTIQISIKRYKELDAMKEDGFYAKLSKKEAARLERERKKLEKNLKGIREMDKLPGAVFIVDSNKETIAVKEAVKLGIPVVAIVDTNCDPDQIEYPIPGNDDALRAVRLFSSTIADAVRAGRAVYDAKVEAERQEARERAREEAARRAVEKEKQAALKAARAKAAAEAAARAEAKAKEQAEAEAQVAKAEEEANKEAEEAAAVEVAEAAKAAQEAKVEAPAEAEEKPAEEVSEAKAEEAKPEAEEPKVAKPRKAVAAPKAKAAKAKAAPKKATAKKAAAKKAAPKKAAAKKEEEPAPAAKKPPAEAEAKAEAKDEAKAET